MFNKFIQDFAIGRVNTNPICIHIEAIFLYFVLIWDSLNVKAPPNLQLR